MQPKLIFIALIFQLTNQFNSYGQDTISRIAFGSCSDQNKELGIFNTIVQHHPDLFIYLGDNIYGDTDNMCVMRRKYRKLDKNLNFRKLKNSTPIIATWDDHDYGQDDIGRHYAKKQQSKKIFLKFFKEPKDSPRRAHEGIYTSYYYPVNGKILQIILLDNRTFRDDLLPYDGFLKDDSLYSYHLDYSPYVNSDSTLLGKTQWNWLEEELRKPADIRIIGSSTQFGTQFNGYETWAHFPHEQQRMLDLITTTNAKGVFFISGDLHYSELSKLTTSNCYPIYDLTSSGLSEEWKFAVPNISRIGEPVMENNFGLININWHLEDIEISMEIWDVNGQIRIQQLVKLSELK